MRFLIFIRSPKQDNPRLKQVSFDQVEADSLADLRTKLHLHVPLNSEAFIVDRAHALVFRSRLVREETQVSKLRPRVVFDEVTDEVLG
jgi:hypothetical protein